MVRNWRTPLIEKVDWLTPDGEVYSLHNNTSRMLLSMQGWGLPRPKFSVTQGPFQHGVTPTAIREQPRKIRLTQRATRNCRDEYWTEREALVDALRRNRANLDLPVPGSLRWYRSNNTIRQVDVFVDRGPDFRSLSSRHDPFAYEENLSFIAHNPVIYDPTQYAVSQTGFPATVQQELQFPMVFDTTHVVFGASASTTETWSTTLSYAGNWQEYPTITITGPGQNLTIKNLSTGYQIGLDYTISAGETIIFNLTYGTKTIINNSGVSLLGYLTTDSDLAVFSIQPHPIVTDGDNLLEVSMTFSSAASSATISYFNRYIGI